MWWQPIRRQCRSAVTPPPPSIIVLPLANLGDDREQQYFTDGLAEDLTTDLSCIGQMFVISHNTALTYRNKTVDTKQIGRELGVRYVLEGGVQRSSNLLRVSVQLSDSERDVNLWAERYDSDRRDLFALQNEITRRIAIALNLQMIRADAESAHGGYCTCRSTRSKSFGRRAAQSACAYARGTVLRAQERFEEAIQ
jgi:adenylate cyclase